MHFEPSLLIYSVLLGLGLAASTGLNAFLPLLMLALAAHFRLGGVQLNGGFAWLGSDTSLFALGIAAVAEMIADKVPLVDHALHAAGMVVRPAAGTLAAASVLKTHDPAMAGIAGLIIGAPTALGVHAAKSTARAASSAATLGLGNPVLSVVEDLMAMSMVVISIAAPLLVPALLVLGLLLAWKTYQRVRARLYVARA